MDSIDAMFMVLKSEYVLVGLQSLLRVGLESFIGISD